MQVEINSNNPNAYKIPRTSKEIAQMLSKNSGGQVVRAIRGIGTLLNAPFQIKAYKEQVANEKLQKEKEEQRAYEKEQLEDARAYNDSFYRRRISDMRKAGINPNLFNNIQGDTISTNSSDNNIMLENLRSMLEEELKGEELSNETFNNIFRSVATILGLAVFKK